MEETTEFRRLLGQKVILENLVLTGLRGVGKTVLLDTLKPIAIEAGWLWVGTDLSELSSISEERVCLRLLTDLAVVTAALKVAEVEQRSIGFAPRATKIPVTLDFATLESTYKSIPGLPSDKLKKVLETVCAAVRAQDHRGVVFAYDEAQNMSDHAAKDEYPLSLLLDVFQSIEKRNLPVMLTLVGLPTLFPKLVEARTFSKRMFRVLFLDRLSEAESREAIRRPINEAGCPITIDDRSLEKIIELSGGYPYFIQFICREVYDAFLQGQESIPIAEITRKLDSDFFAGRWARATDRQRDLLMIIARLENAATEFTVQEITGRSKAASGKPFSASHVNQMLFALANNGLIYKNRHGKYSFAVPLLDRFILRQTEKPSPSTGAQA